MSRVIANKIIAKLERLDEYLRYLRDLQKVNKKSFLQDYHAFGAAERYLQLSIEVLLDIGKLIIVERQFRKPETNQDIFIVLHEHGIIPLSLLKRLGGIAQFRNILVHDYEKIDREIVYKKIQTNFKDFKDFQKAITRYLA